MSPMLMAAMLNPNITQETFGELCEKHMAAQEQALKTVSEAFNSFESPEQQTKYLQQVTPILVMMGYL